MPSCIAADDRGAPASLDRGAMPMTLRAVVVDDEKHARDRLKRLLREEEVTVVGECRNGRDAVAVIEELQPDIVFLDIQMPGLDGFGVLAALRPDSLPAIVVVTAYDNHAITAFEHQAIDYLVKPVQPERLHQAVVRSQRLQSLAAAAEQHARLIAILRRETEGASPPEAAPPAPSRTKRLLIKEQDRRFFVTTDDVERFEASGNYVKLHMLSGQTHLFRGTMAQLETALDANQFVRVHRSSIVNLAAVQEVQPWFSGDYLVVLKRGGKLRLSRHYRAGFERRGLL